MCVGIALTRRFPWLRPNLGERPAVGGTTSVRESINPRLASSVMIGLGMVGLRKEWLKLTLGLNRGGRGGGDYRTSIRVHVAPPDQITRSQRNPSVTSMG